MLHPRGDEFSCTLNPGVRLSGKLNPKGVEFSCTLNLVYSGSADMFNLRRDGFSCTLNLREVGRNRGYGRGMAQCGVGRGRATAQLRVGHRKVITSFWIIIIV